MPTDPAAVMRILSLVDVAPVDVVVKVMSEPCAEFVQSSAAANEMDALDVGTVLSGRMPVPLSDKSVDVLVVALGEAAVPMKRRPVIVGEAFEPKPSIVRPPFEASAGTK